MASAILRADMESGYSMSTIVQCNCGAEYRRTEEKFLVPHAGDAVCAISGAALKS